MLGFGLSIKIKKHRKDLFKNLFTYIKKIFKYVLIYIKKI